MSFAVGSSKLIFSQSERLTFVFEQTPQLVHFSSHGVEFFFGHSLQILVFKPIRVDSYIDKFHGNSASRAILR
jgi:hypothetical protein